jgi:hypothetical protein
VALLILLAPGGLAIAAGDAAIKAQEGSVEHWIEYYKQQREPRATGKDTADAEKLNAGTRRITKENEKEPKGRREVE